jgi:hypothetical protein
MFSFFRKIRHNLLNEGKTARYLKYAIGEILLVVIGIIIALQINNWNENNKERAFELKMLEQIKLALIEDKKHFEMMKERMSQLKSITDRIVDIIANEENIDVDTQFNLIFGLNKGISTQYNRGAYDALMASGIDKVSSDKLRNTLIKFYDYEYPKFISQLNHFDRNYLKNISSNVKFFKDPEIFTRDGQNFLGQNFPEGVIKQPDFQRTLRSIIFRRSSLTRVFEEYIPKIEEMVNQLDAEINHVK